MRYGAFCKTIKNFQICQQESPQTFAPSLQQKSTTDRNYEENSFKLVIFGNSTTN